MMASAANRLASHASSRARARLGGETVMAHPHTNALGAGSAGVADRSGGRLRWLGRGRLSAVNAAPARARRVAAAAMALSFAVAGCSEAASRGSSDQSSTPALSAPPQSARGAAEAQALHAWRGMWQAYAKAGLTANPAEPDLARYAIDRALTTLTDGLKSYKDKGQILKGEIVTDPQVSAAVPDAEPTTVTVTDCVDDSRFLVYHRSGELLNDIPGGRRSALATVTKDDTGGWKVSSFGVQEPGTC